MILARGRTYPVRSDPIDPPLNLLVVLSSPIGRDPADDSLAFDIYEEKRSLLAELAPLVDAGLLQRPLLTADEAMRMPGPKKDGAGNIVEPGDMVVYAAGFPAIYGQQPLYFRDPIFQARAEIPCPDKTDTL